MLTGGKGETEKEIARKMRRDFSGFPSFHEIVHEIQERAVKGVNKVRCLLSQSVGKPKGSKKSQSSAKKENRTPFSTGMVLS